jgi:hypothetical protein
VDGSPLTFLVQKNYIVGQGPTTGAGENGIQISDGATGQVLYNTTVDELQSFYTDASGILVYSSANVEVGFNTVGSTNFGIATVSDPTYPSPQDPTGVRQTTPTSTTTASGHAGLRRARRLQQQQHGHQQHGVLRPSRESIWTPAAEGPARTTL